MSVFLDARAVAAALRGTAHGNRVSAPGPGHSPSDRSLSVTLDPTAPDGFWASSFAGDDWMACRNHVRAALRLPRPNDRRNLRADVRRARVGPGERDHHATARRLWGKRQPITGSIAETYLREHRGITCALPVTLGYLPAEGKHLPAMIAALGLAVEIEPGILAIDERAVMAVHLTRLTPEGRKHPKITVGGSVLEPKIMIGRGALGMPIVLAPMNDLLGLAICEGIEDGLSISQATGLGVWVAGAASRMPALADAIPDSASCVSIAMDADCAGQQNSELLMHRLAARGIYAEIVELGAVS